MATDTDESQTVSRTSLAERVESPDDLVEALAQLVESPNGQVARPTDLVKRPDGVASVFLVAVACMAVVTVLTVATATLWAHRGSPLPFLPADPDLAPRFELRDRLVWIVAVLGSAVVGLLLASPRIRGSRLTRVLSSRLFVVCTLIGALGLAASAGWSDERFGLSPANLALAFVIGPLLVAALTPLAEHIMRWLWAPALVGVTATYLPALWQTPSGLYDPLHSARVLDEVLGPVAGSYPLSDYIPQYGGMLGLPLRLIPGVTAAAPERTVTMLLSLLAIATVVALCATAALMLPPGRRALAPLLIVPMLLMKPAGDGLVPAGVQRLFQSLPERSLLPVLAGFLLVVAATRPRHRRWWPVVGFVAGVAALNNVESGVASTLALALALVALRPGWRAAGLTAGDGSGPWWAISSPSSPLEGACGSSTGSPSDSNSPRVSPTWRCRPGATTSSSCSSWPQGPRAASPCCGVGPAG